jgi:aldehyde dehydrogenase (NAD+)/succinate-semialdehyde dehydrogenase/glutarate-semialdehyde dehydrogenase
LLEDFLRIVGGLVSAVRVGDPRDEATKMGPMASEAQRSIVLAQLADAKAKGARVLIDGAARSPGFFLEPTLITDLKPEMTLVQEETFGPVIAVEVCESAEDAIARTNASPYGLGASIWGEPGPALEELAGRLEVGMIGVNRGLSAAAGGPWIGWKSSGFGYSRSVAGMRQFMQPQSLARTVAEID